MRVPWYSLSLIVPYSFSAMSGSYGDRLWLRCNLKVWGQPSRGGQWSLTPQRKDLESRVSYSCIWSCFPEELSIFRPFICWFGTRVFDFENCGEGNFSSPHAICCYRKNLDSRIFHLDNKKTRTWLERYLYIACCIPSMHVVCLPVSLVFACFFNIFFCLCTTRV